MEGKREVLAALTTVIDGGPADQEALRTARRLLAVVRMPEWDRLVTRLTPPCRRPRKKFGHG
jgi:hypothetical protein